MGESKQGTKLQELGFSTAEKQGQGGRKTERD